MEPVEIDDEDKEDHTYCEKNQDVSGAAASSETPADDTATTKESGPASQKTPERDEEYGVRKF